RWNEGDVSERATVPPVRLADNLQYLAGAPEEVASLLGLAAPYRHLDRGQPGELHPLPGSPQAPRLSQPADRVLDVDGGLNLEQLDHQVALLVAVGALVELVEVALSREFEPLVGHDPGQTAGLERVTDVLDDPLLALTWRRLVLCLRRGLYRGC